MDDPNEPVELYRSRSPAEARALKAHLEAAGVPAHVGGVSPGGSATAPSVLVPSGRRGVAEAVLEEFLAGGGPAGGRGDGESNCLACGAGMGEGEDECRACGWSFYGGEPDEEP